VLVLVDRAAELLPDVRDARFADSGALTHLDRWADLPRLVDQILLHKLVQLEIVALASSGLAGLFALQSLELRREVQGLVQRVVLELLAG